MSFVSVFRIASLAAAAVAASTLTAAADNYPSRPVRVIVPFAPGGPTDVTARLIVNKLAEQTGKQFYVENVGGAGGNVGEGRAAQAAPDGHTILVTGGNHVNNPFLYAHMSYDPIKDFHGVTIATEQAIVLTVNPSVPAKTVKELVELIRATPGKYSYRLARHRNAAATRRRIVQAVAQARSGARAVRRRRACDRLDGRGPHPDLVRRHGAGGAAGQGRQASRARGDNEEAVAGLARRADHGGGRLS